MIVERIDRRVLAAVRFVDAASGIAVTQPLRVSAPRSRWLRNRSGLYVLAELDSLAVMADAFVHPPPQDTPAPLDLEVEVRDAAGRYLDRRFTLRVPRPATAQEPLPADSLFQPVTVAMYPAPASAVGYNWAVLRVSAVRSADPGQGIGGVVLRVVASADQRQLAVGVSDTRGEALVAVPGVPITTWGGNGGQVTATETGVTVEAVHDPAAGGLPDPEAVLANGAATRKSRDVNLRAGRTEKLSFDF